jgi:hypothetical protein
MPGHPTRELDENHEYIVGDWRRREIVELRLRQGQNRNAADVKRPSADATSTLGQTIALERLPNARERFTHFCKLARYGIVIDARLVR